MLAVPRKPALTRLSHGLIVLLYLPHLITSSLHKSHDTSDKPSRVWHEFQSFEAFALDPAPEVGGEQSPAHDPPERPRADPSLPLDPPAFPQDSGQPS